VLLSHMQFSKTYIAAEISSNILDQV